MHRLSPHGSQWLLGLAVCLLALSTVLPQTATAQSVVRARNVAPVVPDKHYFALRAVAAVQRQLVYNLKSLPPAEAIADVRHQLDDLEKLFDKDGVDGDVNIMLKDVRNLTNVYVQYGRSLDAFDEAAVDKLNERMGFGERLGVAVAGAGTSAAIGSQFDSIYGTAIGGLFGFVGSFFLAEGYDALRAQRLAGSVGEERWRKIEAAKKELEQRLAGDFDQHKQLVKKLTARHGWAAGEGGLDATEAEAAGFAKPLLTVKSGLDTAVLDERIKGLAAWAERRPRDPFTRLEYTALAGQREWKKKTATPADKLASASRFEELARNCQESGAQIPTGHRYDPFRVELLLLAGDLMNKASTLEVLAEGKGLFGATSKYAKPAVDIWDACLRYSDQSDPSGYIRMRMAFVEVQAGQFNKGYERATRVAKLREAERCSLFACNFARLATLAGDHDTAMRWAEFAVNKCDVDPGDIASDEHLAQLKQHQPKRFEALIGTRR